LYDNCICYVLHDIDDPVRRKGNHLEQREKLGLTSAPKGQSKSRTTPSESTNAFEKVEVRIDLMQI